MGHEGNDECLGGKQKRRLSTYRQKRRRHTWNQKGHAQTDRREDIYI